MKYLVLVLALSGCATPPQWMADYYDSRDPCQIKNRPEGYVIPNWCGSTRPQQVIRDYTTGRPIAVIK